jgi:hypothetical protein
MTVLALDTSGDKAAEAYLAEWPDRLNARLGPAFADIAATLRAAVLDKLDGGAVKQRSGRLRSAVTVAADAESASVGLDLAVAPYGAALEFGASIPAQLIAAKNARALAFVVGGSQVFAKHVMHPAFALPPHSFLRAALVELAPDMVAVLDDAVAAAMQS